MLRPCRIVKARCIVVQTTRLSHPQPNSGQWWIRPFLSSLFASQVQTGFAIWSVGGIAIVTSSFLFSLWVEGIIPSAGTKQVSLGARGCWGSGLEADPSRPGMASQARHVQVTRHVALRKPQSKSQEKSQENHKACHKTSHNCGKS